MNKFVSFQRHEDNIQEIISADSFNQLADVVEDNERTLYVLKDADFSDKALYVLENHPEANSLWLDDMGDTSNLDFSYSKALAYDEDQHAVTFPANSTGTDDYIYSKMYTTRDGAIVTRVGLVVSEYKPIGTQIIYEISNDGVNWKGISPLGDGAFDLTMLTTAGGKLQVRARVIRTNTTLFPRIDAWAIVFIDPKVALSEGSIG